MPELHAALSHLGADLLVDTVTHLDERVLNASPQNDADATYGTRL